MSYDPAKSHEFAREEEKTHRLLGFREQMKIGDVYGGKDHGFTYTVGQEKCPTKEGKKAFEVGMHFRPRRPL